MSCNEKPSPPATDDDKGTKVQTKVRDETQTQAQAQPQPQKALYVKVENPPELASNKIQVIYNAPNGRLFVDRKTDRLCPKGTWEATCCLFFTGCAVALIFFIMDMFQHGNF